MLNYFVYKNGKGNCWADLAHKHGFFYVGFDEDWPKDLSQSLNPRKFNGGEAEGVNSASDLEHILFLSHDENRGNFLLLTFETTELCIWRITGPTSIAKSDVLSAASKMAAAKLKEYRQYFTGTHAAPFRVLPVELVAEIPRHSLYTSVDSLGSYRYLNSGTCRPVWRSNGPGDVMIPDGLKNKCQQVVPRCDNIGEEKPFGAFVRLYLNGLLHRQGLTLVAADECLGSCVSSEQMSIKFVIGTLNPILVETAALMFVYDLGLMPDIGVGKSKDIIDIRARAIGNDGKLERRIAASAAERFSAIGTNISEAVKAKLISDGTLDIQCKAADRATYSAAVLYFGVKTENVSDRDVIDLVKLADRSLANDFPYLSRFLAMQAAVLRGDFAGPL